MKTIPLVLLYALSAWPALGASQGEMTPGQAEAQRARETAACNDWARDKTGFDSATAASPGRADKKGAVGAGLTGAVGSAALAGISGGMGGVVIGAASNAMTKRIAGQGAGDQTRAEDLDSRHAEQAAFYQARSECLTSRGY